MNEPIITSEIREAPQVIRTQLSQNIEVVATLVRELERKRPPFVATIARGSSDHACTVLKYALETTLGWPTATLGPSVHTLYGGALHLEGALVIAVSQSGSSPDLVETLRMARKSGARTVAVVNVENSELARAAEFVLPICAGEERAVAATTSFMGSLTAFYPVLAALTQDAALNRALERLPDLLEGLTPLEARLSARAERYRFAEHLLVLGRGLLLGIAQEAALKLKEMCGLHAEAISTAEFRHGPMRLLAEGYPLFGFSSTDPAGLSTLSACAEFARQGADLTLLGTGPEAAEHHLALPETDHPLTDPVVSILAFYHFAVSLALRRGQDPDRPLLLSKVTQTR